MPEFLLEIGCEEIPAAWLASLTDQVRERFAEAATREHLAPEHVRAFASPRRLVVAADVRARQEDRQETLWGPSVKVAKDAAGKFTGAAHGFAKKFGVRPEELGVGTKDTPRQGTPGEDLNLYYVRKTPGRAAPEALPAVIASVLRSFAFPKRMNWDAWIDDDKGSFPFGRPIRWLVALLDGAVVPFTVYGMLGGAKAGIMIASGDATLGHRFLPKGKAGRPIRARSFEDLLAKLRDAFVLLDPAERAARIQDGLRKAGAGASFDDHGLLAEWRDLVEYPTIVAGDIPAEFQSLPAEVLATVLVHHQKYIPLSPGAQRAPSRFAAVTNTDGSAAAAIVRGMERVVVARLRDASFFFAEDLKRPLGDRVADLAGVTFHRDLGTYREKAERMAALVDAMGAEMGLLTRPEHQAAQAALLAKADLTTLMVREFPELQGVMGGIYLRAEGGPWENVATAVRWHYHPVSAEEGSEPAGRVSGSDATVFGAVSLADKLDTLAGYFGLGLDPTGSSDPYGLRRAAQGAVRVLLDFWNADSEERRPNLSVLIRKAIWTHGERFRADERRIAQALESFFLERLGYVFTARGFPADEVRAILHPDDDPGAIAAKVPIEIQALEDVHDAHVRLRALHRVRAEAPEDFSNLAIAFKRAKNILEKQPRAPVSPALFQEAAERQLHDAIRGLTGRDGGYEARLRSLAGLRAPIDRFFDDVLVMAEDPKIRANRLGLLSEALSLFYRIADISKLGGQA